MSKVLIVVLVVVLIALVVGDVISISVDFSKLSGLPSRVISTVQNPIAMARVRTGFTQLKRSAEQRLIKDDKRKLALSLLYVKTDAERLQELLKDESADPELIIPQAELVKKSLERAEKQLAEASGEALLDSKDESREALALVQNSLTDLTALGEKLTDWQERFTDLKNTLQEKVDAVTTGKSEEEESEPSASPTASTSKIPLTF